MYGSAEMIGDGHSLGGLSFDLYRVLKRSGSVCTQDKRGYYRNNKKDYDKMQNCISYI